MAAEGVTAVGGQPHLHPAMAPGGRPLDDEVAGLLQRGELLGQRGVGQPEPITDEREVDPVSRRQQRDDRQPGAGVDDLVELRDAVTAGPSTATPLADDRISCGPPVTMSTATSMLATVTGWPEPSSAASTDARTAGRRAPAGVRTTSMGTCRPATSARTLS